MTKNFNNIHKLKVIKIIDNGIIVQQMDGTSGFIHISEISNTFVSNIHEHVEVDTYVYGALLRSTNSENYFSLKAGQTMNIKTSKKNKIRETGGGYLGIIYLQNKILAQGESND